MARVGTQVHSDALVANGGGRSQFSGGLARPRSAVPRAKRPWFDAGLGRADKFFTDRSATWDLHRIKLHG